MPDFEKLHTLAQRLADLTKEPEFGLLSWCQMAAETWKEIAEMWGGPLEPPPAPADPLDRLYHLIAETDLVREQPQIADVSLLEKARTIAAIVQAQELRKIRALLEDEAIAENPLVAYERRHRGTE